MNDTLKKVIGAVAPTLATALGGPMAGVAVKALADKFTGGNVAVVPEYLTNASPQDLVELKQLDKDFQIEMRKLDIDLEKINAEDRKGARDLAQKKGIWPQASLTFLWTLGYFGALYVALSGLLDIPPEHKGLADSLIMTLTVVQAQILAFWFGSSSGSKDKTQAMAGVR